MLVYLDQRGLGAFAPVSAVSITLFAGLALLVLLRFRVAGERRFAFTTLDALVLFVAVVTPFIAGSSDSGAVVGLGIVKLVALGYALEFAFEEERAVAGGALVAALLLALVSLRSLLPM